MTKSKRPTREERTALWLGADPSRAALVERMKALANYDRMNFFAKMCHSYEEWGSLTEKQEAAVRKIIVARDAEIADAKAKGSRSNHVGTVGQRHTFTGLHITMVAEKWVTFSNGGLTKDTKVFVTVMEDKDGNVIVCKSSVHIGERGDHVDVAGYVKEHKLYQGIAQTNINRPVVTRSKQGRAVGSNYLPVQTTHTVTRDRRQRDMAMYATADECRYYTEFDNT